LDKQPKLRKIDMTFGIWKIDRREIGWVDTGWIHLTQDRDQQWRTLVDIGTNLQIT
jgi:hypothetical protein